MKVVRSFILSFGLFLVILWGALYTQERLSRHSRDLFSAPYADALRSQEATPWTAEGLRFVSFGQWPALIDWLWIRGLQQIDQLTRSFNVKSQFAYDVDVITDLDPRFYGVYAKSISVFLVLRDDFKTAEKIIKKAVKFSRNLSQEPPTVRALWANHFFLYIQAGYLYAYELGNLEEAGRYFSEAANLPGAPDYLKSLSKRFETFSGKVEIARRFLEFVRKGNPEESVRLATALKQKNLELFVRWVQIENSLKARCNQAARRSCFHDALSGVSKKDRERLEIEYDEKIKGFRSLYFEKNRAPLGLKYEN